MVIITGTFRLPTDSMILARAAMRTMLAASRAEDGCLRYAYGEDVLEPGLIWVSESWRDATALEAHSKSAHMAAWRVAGAELGLHARDLTVYEAVSANPL
jgi:quinol monooxygenase YgiN